jgi:hypothetical protein
MLIKAMYSKTLSSRDAAASQVSGSKGWRLLSMLRGSFTAALIAILWKSARKSRPLI